MGDNDGQWLLNALYEYHLPHHRVIMNTILRNSICVIILVLMMHIGEINNAMKCTLLSVLKIHMKLVLKNMHTVNVMMKNVDGQTGKTGG